MAELPGRLSAEHDRDLVGRDRDVWVRRLLLGLLAAFAVAALLNVFGQRTATTSVHGAAASLSVNAPERLRGGLIFQGRFDIQAEQAIEHPKLVLSSGWLEAMTLNTTEPEPLDESSRDGGLELAFGPLAAGDGLTVRTEWQVNPTTVGSRTQDVALYDGKRELASVDRSMTVFP